MSSVKIETKKLPKVVWKDVKVITTELLAKVYGTATTNIKSNFNYNKGRFIEGKHYYRLTGAALREFKNNRVVNSDSVTNSRAKEAILWTARGAARHAKMLETDQAWDVFEQLEDSYFANREKVRRSTTYERAEIAHKVIDIGIDRGISPCVVQGIANRWVGVRRSRDMTTEQIPEAVGFCDRLHVRGESDDDWTRVDENSIKLYGRSPQLSLLPKENALSAGTDKALDITNITVKD